MPESQDTRTRYMQIQEQPTSKQKGIWLRDANTDNARWKGDKANVRV
jgi:hypothetical protein